MRFTEKQSQTATQMARKDVDIAIHELCLVSRPAVDLPTSRARCQMRGWVWVRGCRPCTLCWSLLWDRGARMVARAIQAGD